MSSRALRKAQREREEHEQLRRLQQQDEASDEEDEVEASPKQPQRSAFAMLGEDTAEDGGKDEDARDEGKDEDHSPETESDVEIAAPKTAPKRKKKRKGKGGPKVAPSTATASEGGESLDDIDLALQSLSTKDASTPTTGADSTDPAVSELCHLLSIDTQCLHAQNEMRKLFGRAALESHEDDDQHAGGRRRRRGQQQMGLAAAVGRRQGGQGGRGAGLGLLGLRRNIFIQGKEEWPVGTSGGLGMEIVERRPDGTIEYRFVHNKTYQDVQGQFEACVASMDPQRMVQLLQFNPYHVSTVLQVSEIAKQERDASTAGDLLERALFSFGRAVHSSFSTNLAQGKARLDFRRPENREFWLAANRYITNLSMRATWRTVFEWAKLMLSLDPEGDPYRMSLVIDQYALRARQPQQLIDISSCQIFAGRWKQLPNIQLSRGLAFAQAGQEAKGKQTLYTAISRHSWAVGRLFRELGVDAPPAVWGKSPRTDWEKLHSELYAVRAKDVWNTPEATNLLVEVSSAVSMEVPEPPLIDRDITPDEGRHVLLTDLPPLIALLPRSITNKITSASDPLPPDDNLPSYAIRASQRQHVQGGGSQLSPTAENLRELQNLYIFFADLFPWFNPRGGPEEHPPEITEEEIERRIADSGVDEQMIVQRTQRMMELQHGLMAGLDEAEARQVAEAAENQEE